MVSLCSSSLLSSVSSSSSATYSQEVLGEVNSQTLSLHYLPVVAEVCVCSYPDVWGWVGKANGRGRPPQLSTLHHSRRKLRLATSPIIKARAHTAHQSRFADFQQLAMNQPLTSLDVKLPITAPLSESVYSSSFCGQKAGINGDFQTMAWKRFSMTWRLPCVIAELQRLLWGVKKPHRHTSPYKHIRSFDYI